MPRSVKVSALLTIGLSILFFLFFDICKHALVLSQINVFTEDPYDSVGSFGVQLAPFMALLAVLRAFRQYPSEKTRDRQVVLFARAAYFSCLAVAVTLGAEMIAMIRHPSLWIGVAGGYLLAALLAGMILVTALVLWAISNATRPLPLDSPLQRWIKASVFSLAGILLLAFYPEDLRQSIHGEILTIVTGIIFLFGLVWALGTAISPSLELPFEDVIDDLAITYQWQKARVNPSNPLLALASMLEKLLTLSLVRTIIHWFNPRRHPWNLVILLGVCMGIVLLLAEFSGEGGPPQLGRLALVAFIFISVEFVGVLAGYVLLAKPAGLFRQEVHS
ncbi:MAG: hypothetical protein ACXWPS_10430 [Ktedonobacteraceae bacterium]